MMNIREFAVRCRVGIASASRALNLPFEQAQMTRETYDRIRAKAEELGYRPDYHLRAFHSKFSGNIGFIAGLPLDYIGISLLEGVSDTLERSGMTITIASPRRSTRREVESFEKLFYRKVDAVIYLPVEQEGEYRTGHLEEMLTGHPDHPPILSLLAGVRVPGMSELRMKDAQAGEQAALRQLQLGCRKFGIVTRRFATPSTRIHGDAYRNTLLKNGIGERDIREIQISYPPRLEMAGGCGDFDGLWVPFCLVLPECHFALSRVCDPKAIHIDTISTLESEDMLLWLQMEDREPDRFFSHFGSVNIFNFSAREIGVQAARMVLKMIRNPALRPSVKELEWRNS